MFLILYQREKNVKSGNFSCFVVFATVFVINFCYIFIKVRNNKSLKHINKSTIERKEESLMKITDTIKYVGVNDHQVDLFEGQY